MVQNLAKAELDYTMQQRLVSWNFEKVCATNRTPGSAEAKARAIPKRCCSLSDSLGTGGRHCGLMLQGCLRCALQPNQLLPEFHSLPCQRVLHLLCSNSDMMLNDAKCSKMLCKIAELSVTSEVSSARSTKSAMPTYDSQRLIWD